MRGLASALLLAACGGGTSSRAANDAGPDVAQDAGPDVPADAPRELCPDSAPDGGPTLCPPGMICCNTGGRPGNFCCYPAPGTPRWCQL